MKRKFVLLALLALSTLSSVQAQRKRVSPYGPKLEQLYNQTDAAQSCSIQGESTGTNMYKPRSI